VNRPSSRIPYDFAVLRAVPHPHLEWWVPVGVVVHARTVDYLGARTLDNAKALAQRVPDVETDVLQRYLRAWVAIAEGRLDAGPVALLPASERFHWLTCPRSDVLQCSRVHGGVGEDPARVLEELWKEHVASWKAPARGV
jgi:hypothetical protein